METTQFSFKNYINRRYKVTRKELPVYCPGPDMPLWSAHPKVYLPIKETGVTVCPYCSAEFTLIDFLSENNAV